MKKLIVAYLTNQYPTAVRVALRREILAVEAQGVAVERFTIRRSSDELPTGADREEAAKTRAILDVGALRLGLGGLVCAFGRPARFAAALRAAIRLGRGSSPGLLKHLAYLVEACVLVRWLEQCSADHLHVHFGTNPATVALLCRTLGGPGYSLTVHGPEEFEKAEGLRLAEKVIGAEFVVAVSEDGLAHLRERCPSDQLGKLHRIGCGVPRSYIDAAVTEPPSARRLLYVGRLAPEKRVGLLLEAVAELVARGRALELVIVGDGPSRRELQTLVGWRGLGSVVEFTGMCDEDTVRDRIMEARALVLTSCAEGLPVVIMEAFALGRPVVATAVAGTGEMVVTGETGWLVPMDDREALITALEDALDRSPAELAALAAAGRRLVRDRHDVDRNAAALAALFTGTYSSSSSTCHVSPS